jgi:hypothetical protein
MGNKRGLRGLLVCVALLLALACAAPGWAGAAEGIAPVSGAAGVGLQADAGIQAQAEGGLKGVAPTAPGGANGRITGTTAQMVYRAAGNDAASWTQCTGEAVTGLKAGTYLVRLSQATGEHAAVRVPVGVGSITLQPGRNEREMNFTWYTGAQDPAFCEVQIVALATAGAAALLAEAPASFIGKSTAGKGVRSNQVTVCGLKPETTYLYRLGNGMDYSAPRTFTTRDARLYTAVLVGDPQIGALGRIARTTATWQKTLAAALSAFPRASFILSVGDQVEYANDESHYAGFLSPPALQSVPLAAAIGNHDNGYLFKRHFNPPNSSASLGKTWAGGDYWFTYGNTLYLMLNSNHENAAQHEAFLRDAIRRAGPSVVWKVAVYHHSLYSSGTHANEADILSRRKKMTPIFDSLGIDLVLMGHDHCYTRTFQMRAGKAVSAAERAMVDPSGTMYITLGTAAGSKYYGFRQGDKLFRAVRWQGYEPSYAVLSAGPRSLSVTTYEADSQRVIDEYAIMKTPVLPVYVSASTALHDGTTDR